MQTTAGQILVNAALPKHLRDYARVLDKKGVSEVMELLAKENDPELYKKALHALHSVGSSASQSAGASFSIYDLRVPPKTKIMVDNLKDKLRNISESDLLGEEEKEKLIVDLVSKQTQPIEDMMFKEALAADNPFAIQVLSGSRGGKADLRSLLVGDMLVTDHKDRVIGIPLTSSYSSGLTPSEYWAGSYGARKGVLGTKLATQQAGDFGKQLVNASHQQVVTEHDCKTERGIPVAGNDPDNDGALLASTSGDFKRNSEVSPRVRKQLGDSEILVRSPLTCEAKNGVCAKCVGVRERGGLPDIGDNVGVAAAQSIAERVSQMALNTKHTGGRADPKKTRTSLEGFDLVNQLVQVPKTFRDSAAVASVDGTVKSVTDAPQGGKFVVVGDQQHFVPSGFEVQVKPGDRVEAGDIMSEGIPNPADLVKHRGLGAGRLEFVNLFRKAFTDQGLPANRRNIEIMTRGLANHVRVTELDGPDNSLPDDVLEYTSIERGYRPRYGARTGNPTAAIGRYLEKPALHYTIGTRVTKRVAEKLKKSGVGSITYHHDTPSFAPEMIRARETVSKSPDWQVRLGGWGLQKGLLEGLHRGATSDINSTSYIPAMARSKGFGTQLQEEGVY